MGRISAVCAAQYKLPTVNDLPLALTFVDYFFCNGTQYVALFIVTNSVLLLNSILYYFLIQLLFLIIYIFLRQGPTTFPKI